MNKPMLLKATMIASLLAASTAFADMDRAQYKASQDRIEADYKMDKANCDKMSGNAKDVCQEEAKGKEKVAKAELDAQRSGKPADQRKVAEAKAEAQYAVAKEKCDDLSGDQKNACQKEAKAVEAKAMADAKAMKG